MDGYVATGAVEGECADKAGKTEYVIAVQVCQENMAQSCEWEPLPHKGELCPLPAVDHEKVAAVVDHGRRWLMAQRRPCRSASESMYRE